MVLLCVMIRFAYGFGDGCAHGRTYSQKLKYR